MKFFNNKNLIQKMIIVLVILILFNFIRPYYVKASFVDTLVSSAETIGEGLVSVINYIARFIGDAVVTLLQKMFIGTDPSFEDDMYIAISPGKIFSGVIYMLDVNFLSTKEVDSTTSSTVQNTSTENITEEQWYADYLNARGKLSTDVNPNKYTDEQYLLLNDLLSMIPHDDSTKITEFMSNWVTAMNGRYDEDAMNAYFEDLLEEAITFHNESQNMNVSYDDNAITEIMNSVGFDTVVEEYCEYLADNDSALYFASKQENAPAYVLHGVIASWYKIMRNISVLFLLSVLVYIGIRIMLASTAADNTKYKKMLINWVVALCILFALHYLMSLTINITQLITDAFNGGNVTADSGDEIMQEIRSRAANSGTTGFGYTLLYLVLIFYIIYFLFYYIKRVVYIAFLTMIGPLVAVTYPMDKMGDSKAQAFNMWTREYIMTILSQPIHLIIYTVMISSAISLATSNPIYAIVVIGAMIPAEKFIKEMFGLNSQKGPNGGLLAGAAIMTGVQKLASRKPPQFGHHPGGKEGKNTSSEKEETNKKPRMDGEKFAENSKSWTDTQSKTLSKEEQSKLHEGTENKKDIDNGEFPDSRSTDDVNSGSQQNTGVGDSADRGSSQTLDTDGAGSADSESSETLDTDGADFADNGSSETLDIDGAASTDRGNSQTLDAGDVNHADYGTKERSTRGY